MATAVTESSPRSAARESAEVPVCLDFGWDPRTVAAALIVIALGFAAIDLIGQAPRYFGFTFPQWRLVERLFHMGGEANLPSWFSTILLFGAAVLLALIAWAKQQTKDAFRWHWAGLSALFVYLSADEAAMLHERITGVLAGRFPGGVLNYGGWIGYGLVALAVIGVAFLRFFLALPARTRTLFAASGAIFVLGAMGVEVLALPYEAGRTPDYRFALLVALEETMELIGIAVFVGALIAYLREHTPVIELRFNRAAGRPPAATPPR